MPKSRFDKFEVYWWISSCGPDLYRYSTLTPEDIECFSKTHYRIRVHAADGSGEFLEIILSVSNGQWKARCSSFDDPAESYPFAYAETDWESLWTDAVGDELMVIRGLYH